MKVLKWLDEHFEEVMLSVVVCFIACSMMLQVIMRFIFKNALPWPEELSQYSLVLACFISIPYCIRKGNVIRIDILLQRLPKMAQKIADTVIHLIMIGLLIWLFIGGKAVYADAAAHNNLTATLRLPTAVIYGLCLVFLIVGIFRMVQHIVLLFLGKASATSVDAEAESAMQVAESAAAAQAEALKEIEEEGR